MSQPSKRFRVAFSFAGEKRAFVEMVAGLLAVEFGKRAILYDKYHEAEFARRDLGIYLPELYHKETDLVVLVLCSGYESKQWTGLEWTAIHDLLNQRREDEVFLCRFDHATVKGIYSTAGFIELDGRAEREIVTLILERLAAVDLRRMEEAEALASPAAAPLATSIPHNLPTLQPFFGREKELAKIADVLAPECRGWGALIDGPGGMGKTSLAVRAAYDVSPAVFQKIIFISLKTRELDDDGLRDLSGFILSGLAELFGELARELGRSEIVEAAEEQRPRLLLNALRGTRTLLLLDNLESLLKKDRDTVLTFVKKLPKGCKAILTSRELFGNRDDSFLLYKLSEAAALAVLAELATHNSLLAQTSDAERLILYRETGGQPLLLRWAAGQLGRGRYRTIADALALMRAAPSVNNPLEFVFGDLLDTFAKHEIKVLAALAYFTTETAIKLIAELADLDDDDAHSALCDLSSRALVLPGVEKQHFLPAPMVADFLRHKRPEAVAETGGRLEKRAYALIVENGYDRHGRFSTLDAAWPTVAPALPLMIAGPNPRLQTVCDALGDFLNFTGRRDEWLSLSQLAEAKAVSARDFEKAGWRAHDAGWVHHMRAQAEDLLACADRAAEYWRNTRGDSLERSLALQLRGKALQLNNDYPAAIATFREALALDRRRAAGGAAVAAALNDLAVAQQGSGDLAAAERNTREALGLADAVGSIEGVVICTANLAELALKRKDWPVAEALAREALPLSEAVGQQELIAANCCRLAAALVRQGKGAEGRLCAQRAVDLYSVLGSRRIADALQILHECGASPSVQM